MATRIYSPELAIAVNKLDRLGSSIRGEADLTTRKFAEQILWDSDNIPPIVPEDTGALRSTGHVEQVEGGKPVTWAIVYGGSANNGILVDYANEVHDDLRPRHYQRSGSGAKFVEAHVERRKSELSIALDQMLLKLTTSIFGR